MVDIKSLYKTLKNCLLYFACYLLAFTLHSLFYNNVQCRSHEKYEDEGNHALHINRTLEVYMRFVYVILLYSRN